MTLAIPIEAIAIPLLVLILYRPCLKSPFLFDDLDTIAGNRQVRERQWHRMWRWRPITQISYALQNRSINRSLATDHEPVSLHIVNILIHAAVALVVEQILLALGRSHGAAIAGAVLYAVHPWSVNTVCYLSGRASLLSTLGGTLGLWAALAHHPLMAVPAVMAAAAAKEDGVLV